MKLVRKIERSKWRNGDLRELDLIPADAITNCMKTQGNTVSVWRVVDAGELNEAVLAMASEFDHLDSIDVVVLDHADLESAGLEIIETPGRTPIIEIANMHRDVCNLNYRSLGCLAAFIAKCIRANEVTRIPRSELKQILIDAIREGRLLLEQLKERVREKLQGAV
jgi:hypothetical protein